MGICGSLLLQDTLTLQSPPCAEAVCLPAPAPRWYAVFTLTNHEKKVFARCEHTSVESFLPLYNVKRKWKNRCTVDLDLPLFPNYLFVRMASKDRVRVLDLPGVVSIVSSGGQLSPVADDYVAWLRDALLARRVEPHGNVDTGELVRIKSGPLAGTEGILERRKNDFRVVLKLEMLARSLCVEVNAEDIEPCSRPQFDPDLRALARHSLA
jgi:transcription termination/antitermination protein NusG